jgi:hypothetical protein
MKFMNLTKRHAFTCLAMLLFIMGVRPAIADGQVGNEQKTMENQTDEQVIVALSCQDSQKSHQAVEEVMQRGEHMIPLLLRSKGNTQAFYGYGLGNRSSAFLLPSPTGNKRLDEGSVITVEVAALYLISALYHQTLEFAEAPYLTDGTHVKEQKFNTPKRVAAAWASVEKWAQALKGEGLESLRAKQHSPLKDSVVRFWGSH